MHSRNAAPCAALDGMMGGMGAATVSQLLQDARDLLHHDRQAAARTLLHASRLLDAPAADVLPMAWGIVPGGLARWQVMRLTRYVEAHLDQPITHRHLSSEIRLSSGHFARAFKQSFGRTAHTYVVERRIARAKELMLHTSAPLSEIAFSCGLSDQAHLSRLFRRAVGSTPLAWRRQHQPAPARRAGERPGP